MTFYFLPSLEFNFSSEKIYRYLISKVDYVQSQLKSWKKNWVRLAFQIIYLFLIRIILQPKPDHSQIRRKFSKTESFNRFWLLFMVPKTFKCNLNFYSFSKIFAINRCTDHCKCCCSRQRSSVCVKNNKKFLLHKHFCNYIEAFPFIYIAQVVFLLQSRFGTQTVKTLNVKGRKQSVEKKNRVKNKKLFIKTKLFISSVVVLVK